ncbi:hypothetical protein [Gemmatimonas sp.]|uniref:hypothetical protein n=1 Tax=Gemmatimonas sp. TaxID=1962908 RepID=UPI003919A104
MMDLFAKRSHGHVDHLTQVKAWVRELMDVSPNAAVLVTELRCTEPGCPPLDTVIAILADAVAPRQYTLHRAVADVTRQDIADSAAPTRRG